MPRAASTPSVADDGSEYNEDSRANESGGGGGRRLALSRQEYIGPQPEWSDTEQVVRLWTTAQDSELQVNLNPVMESGFFLDGATWTCYRRNYFQINTTFTLSKLADNEIVLSPPRAETETDPSPIAFIENTDGSGEKTPIFGFLVGVSVLKYGSERAGIHLLQFTGKRERGEQTIPEPLSCVPSRSAMDAGPALVQALDENGQMYSVNNPAMALFPRLQFNSSTQKGRTQEYYQLRVELYADIGGDSLYAVAQSLSAPLVVRGRGPGHYQNKPAVIGGVARERKTTINTANTELNQVQLPSSKGSALNSASIAGAGAGAGPPSASSARKTGAKRGIDEAAPGLNALTRGRGGSSSTSQESLYPSPQSPEDSLALLQNVAAAHLAMFPSEEAQSAVDGFPGAATKAKRAPSFAVGDDTKWLEKCAVWIRGMCSALNRGEPRSIAEKVPHNFTWTTHAPVTFPWAGATVTADDAADRFGALCKGLSNLHIQLDRLWIAKPHVLAFQSPVEGQRSGSRGDAEENAGILIGGEPEVMATLTLSFSVANEPNGRGQVSLLQCYGGWRKVRGGVGGERSQQQKKPRTETAGKSGTAAKGAGSTAWACELMPGTLEEWSDTYSMAEILAPSK